MPFSILEYEYTSKQIHKINSKCKQLFNDILLHVTWILSINLNNHTIHTFCFYSIPRGLSRILYLYWASAITHMGLHMLKLPKPVCDHHTGNWGGMHKHTYTSNWATTTKAIRWVMWESKSFSFAKVSVYCRLTACFCLQFLIVEFTSGKEDQGALRHRRIYATEE